MALPLPSVWEILTNAWLTFAMLLRVVWPLILLALSGKVLLASLGHWTEQRQQARVRRLVQPHHHRPHR